MNSTDRRRHRTNESAPHPLLGEHTLQTHFSNTTYVGNRAGHSVTVYAWADAPGDQLRFEAPAVVVEWRLDVRRAKRTVFRIKVGSGGTSPATEA